jgi:hypothetical protein
MTPKQKVRAYSLWFFLLLALVVIVFLLLPPEAPPKGDLTVTFLGMTNNPVRAVRPVRLELFQGATGLCAVFEVKSLATKSSIQYKQESIEKRTEAGWITSSHNPEHTGIAGMRWTPGYRSLYALAWPPDLPTNATWRVVLSVQRETEGFRRWANERLRREIFKLPTYGKHTIYSGEVDASVPFVMPK